MPSSYPGALDNLPAGKTNSTAQVTDHPGHHNDLANAVNAVQAELGLTPSGDAATVAARFSSLFPVFHAADDGLAAGGTAAANKTAIDSTLSRASSAGGGIVLIPAGSFATNGGHVIPVGVTVMGLRRQTTTLRNRGATYCFRLIDETSGGAGCALRDIFIEGSSGTDAAVSGGVGVEISNGQGHDVEGVFIYGFTSSGKGLYFHNISGTVEYVEHNHVANCAIVNCSELISFTSDASAGASFGYNQLLDIQMQIYASQTAIAVGDGAHASTLYNSRIIGQLHYTGNNGVGVVVRASGAVWQGTLLDIRGELLAAYTGCQRIQCVAAFAASGTFYIANTQPPDDVASATSYTFVENLQTNVEATSTHNFTIASAASITIPGGSEFFEVTGTTSITGIAYGYEEGKRVTLAKSGAGTVTVTDGGNLKLAGNFALTGDSTISLVHRNGVWKETGRSTN